MRACPECLAVFVSDPEFCSFDGTRLLTEEHGLRGKVFAGYRIDELVGIGGTGCVFSGARVTDGTRVAIKVLFGEMATDKSIAARFEREAEAMSAIRHRNVVAILDYGRTDAGLVYLVMAYLDGVTLRERIEQSAPLTKDHAGRILEELTAGLAEAHRQGYVHRDLKPGNVILVGPFGREEVKILDFGIVASLREGTEKERLTKTGYIIGTPTYMAPEQVDPSAITPQVDVYALGVILYEMLKGEAPFNGTLEQILVAKMTTKAKPIEGGGDLGELALRMLAMEPGDRPPSALHVSAELSRLSLLTDDPATVRADAPALEKWSAPTAAQDVRLIDRTDANDFVEETHEDVHDEWSSETRRVDASEDLIEFGEVSTRSQLTNRADTVIDQIPDDEAFDGLPAMVTPKDDDALLDADTGDQDVGEEIPTRITERPDLSRPTSPTDAAGTPRAFEVAETDELARSLPSDFEPTLLEGSDGTDDVDDADTALDMQLDHLLGIPEVAPVRLPSDANPITAPLGATPISAPTGTAVEVVPTTTSRRPRKYLAAGIVLAVFLGIAAAVVIIAATHETVIVDVNPERR